MRNILFSLIILTFSISCAQNKKEEILTDGNGKVIDIKEIVETEDLKIKTQNEVVEEFYLNQNSIKALDKLMSFRFYQKTSYSKFKETMESKFVTFGKLTDYKIVETKYSDDKKAVAINTEVQYEKIKTTEQIVLIKETDDSNYQVFEYNVKRI